MLRGLVRALYALGPAALFGCTLPELDPTGKACPCPADYDCEPVSQTCVPAGGGTAGAPSSSTSGSAGSGNEGGNLCAGVCGTPGCGECPNNEVIAGDGYDIDATEVTAAAYLAFLAVKPDPGNQPPYCLHNVRFEPIPDEDDMFCEGPVDVETFPNRPIVCIDWCDARAYCEWAGRHLCGRIGGGALLQEQALDPELSEWHRACTNAGTRIFPYGDVFEPTACNTNSSGWGAFAADVAQAPECVGGYRGLHDMSGNVEEWEDACGSGVDPDDPADDGCLLRGGAFWSEEEDARCDADNYSAPRSGASNDWGFRCCGG